MNTPPGTLDLTYEDLETKDNIRPYPLTEKDSLLIWYDQVGSNSWRLMIQKDSILNDTISINAKSRTSFLETGTLGFRSQQSTKPGKCNPSKPIQLAFSHPLESFDTTFLKVVADTTMEIINPEFSIDTTDLRKLSINHSWKSSIPYVIQVLPGGVTDIFGLKNKDTLNLKYTPDLKKSFGNIKLSITGLADSLTYLGELLDKNAKIVESFTIRGQETFEREFKALSPGEYKVKVVTDWNNNGFWDTGSYDDKRQPEPILEKVLEKLRANWDVEASLNLSEQ